MIGAGGPNQEKVSSNRIAEGCIGSKVGNTEVLPEGCIRTNGAVEEHRRSGVEVIWLYINKDDISKQSISADVSCLRGGPLSPMWVRPSGRSRGEELDQGFTRIHQASHICQTAPSHGQSGINYEVLTNKMKELGNVGVLRCRSIRVNNGDHPGCVRHR